MPNRRLTPTELQAAGKVLDFIRSQLETLAGGDSDLLFALRRKVYKELGYDERDKPGVRKKLKALKRKEQNGICPKCKKLLPAIYCVLDRFNAADGYTVENTRLICQPCDIAIQMSRGYA
jgi:hypothetical protein